MAERFSWPDLLSSLLAGTDLSVSESTWAMRKVMAGEATPSQLGGFLMALRAKGETVEEIVGFRDAILEAAVPLPVRAEVLDIVGTGGDRYGTVNISTMAAIVAAASGVPVVKHGNRAASSASGSSDVLSSLGIGLTLSPEKVAEILDRTGITFAFASAFHPGSGTRRPRGRSWESLRSSTSSVRSATRLAPRPMRSASPTSTASPSSRASSARAARRRWCSAATTASTN